MTPDDAFPLLIRVMEKTCGPFLASQLVRDPIRPVRRAVLGLLGLGTVALVASADKLGFTEGPTGLLPWVIVFGALAQIIASITEFKRANTFGATMFGGYGLYWLGLGMLLLMGFEGDSGAAQDQLGFVLIAVLIFTTFMMMCAGAMNKSIFFVFLSLEVMFAAMILNIFNGLDIRVAGAAAICRPGSGNRDTARGGHGCRSARRSGR